MIRKLLLPLLLLPSCSLLFQDPADDSGADGGAVEPDGPPGNVDAALDSTAPDSAQDAMALPPDAAICDPFTELGCYVENYPLGGPYLGSLGVGDDCSACTVSNDCAPRMFCTGVGGTEGFCLRLCDQSNPCSVGACLSTNWQSYGFCEKQF